MGDFCADFCGNFAARIFARVWGFFVGANEEFTGILLLRGILVS